MSYIAVSSFSLYRELGPLSLSRRDADGVVQVTQFPLPSIHTLEEFVALVPQRLGVSTVELCQMQFGDASPERIAALRSALQAAEVELLTLPIDLGDLSDPTHTEEDVAAIVLWFDIAQQLGARYVRVRIGSASPEQLRADRSHVVDALRELAAAAYERGLQLLVENHGGASSDPDILLALREEVGPENLGILLDVGNFEPITDVSIARILGGDADDSGLETEHVYDKIARIAPVATLVHAKAHDPKSDGSPLLDLNRALQVVAASAYDGPISIEWEGVDGDPWARTTQTIETVKRVFPTLRTMRG